MTRRDFYRMSLVIAGAVMIALLGGCEVLDSSSGDVPPTVASLDTLPTAEFLTQNAPPPGFSQFSAPGVDVNLNTRQGWAYTVSGRFKGTFADDGSPAEGDFTVLVRANELGEARHVILDVSGPAMLPDGTPIRLEGVRFSNDYYLVDVNGVCSTDQTGSAIADLTAAQLIGGVRMATPTGFQDEIQGVRVWEYGFAREDVVLPPTTLKLDSNSTVSLEASLWVAPELNAVLRYDVTLELVRARLLSSERAVTGTLILRYDLDVAQFDTLPTLSVPHGC